MDQTEKNITLKIKDKIKRRNPFADVILFGSHARGQSNDDSDWDILILLEKNFVSRTEEMEFRNEIYDIELEIEQPISTFVFSKSEWEIKHKNTPLYQNIKREGIYL